MLPVVNQYYQIGVPVTHAMMKCLAYDRILDQGVFVDVFSGLCLCCRAARCYGIILSTGRILDQQYLAGIPYDWHSEILRGELHLCESQYKEHPRYYIFLENQYAVTLKGE